MSTAGQVVGGVVGAVAGFFIGGGPTGALYGAQIGIMAGGYLDPPKGPTQNGPRLNDLSVQTSTYGAVIPRVYGTVTVNGNVFWLENNQIKETVTKKKSGGKGGGSKTTTRTYTYSATFAVGLCKGPIAGVRRIWIGPDLFYDAGSSDPSTIAASNTAANGFAIYTGTDTQSADARMQATLGSGNTPAWRGLAYIVFYDLPLAKYSNSLMGAQARVEVVQSGTIQNYPASRHDMPDTVSFSDTAWNGSLFVRLAYFQPYVWTSPDGVTWTKTATGFGSSCVWGAGSWGTGIAYGNGVFVAPSFESGMPVWVSSDGFNWVSYPNPSGNGAIAFGNGKFVIGCADGAHASVSTNGTSWSSHSLPYNSGGNGSKVAFNGAVFLITMDNINRVMVSSTAASDSWSGGAPNGVALSNHNFVIVKNGVFFLGSNGGIAAKTSTDGITWTDVSVIPYSQSMVADDQNFICFGNDRFGVSPDGVTWTTYATLVNTGPYVAPCWNGSVISVANSLGATAYIIQRLLISSTSPTLDNIVSAECLQSGLLNSGDIDVTALASTNVRGYRIGSVGAIRAAIEPLQASWPFDVVQHGYKIQYVLRGGSSVVTIPAADLDARSAGQQPGVQITTAREMDSQLPRRVTVQHLDYDREYNAGTQYAERLNTAAINAQILDLPIVLTATEAAGKAEVLLYLYWLERYDVAVNLPPTYNQLEPGDVVTLVTPEGNVQLRLVEINYTSDGRVEAKAKYANPAIYAPTAIGASPAVAGPTTIPSTGPSDFVLLDVPHMNTAQDTPSFLATMYGSSGWPGGVLIRTDDDGMTWNDIQAFAAPGGKVGAATNTIGSVDSRVWDKASALNVTMYNGTLSSTTELAVLNGGNYFAYGTDGRWEIIAAQTCTMVSGMSYVLTNLLRGRFGTEWAMSTHVVGDKVAALSTNDVTAIGMSSSSIGLSRAYRGITEGQDISTGTDTSFTYNGVNLECLSPAYFRGDLLPLSTDWGMTWIRRSRTDGEWRDLVDAGLSETTEAYEIDIYSDNTFTVVKRTIAVTTPSCTYTTAQQTADFGAVQTTIYVKLYQLSSVVGRGYPNTVTFIAGANDPYWSNVVLSMPMDVAGIIDLKGHTATVAGGAAVSAAQSLTDGYSMYFDGVDDRVSFASTSDWDMSGGTFTFEWDMYPTTMPSSGNQCRVFLIGANGSASALYIGFDNVGAVQCYVPSGSPSGLSAPSGTVVVNTHNTFELSVSSGTIRLFKSGVLVGGPATLTLPSSASNQLFLGWDTSATVNFKYVGYLDRVRITKGVARHTADFTFDPSAFPTY